MNGPIRTLLERRPLRNAVRRLIGMSPRYGYDAMDTMSATDQMQGADLSAAPTRIPPRPLADNQQFVGNTTAQVVSPSPEARAVRLQRDKDSDRRVQARRQADGIATPAPKAPEPPQPAAQTAAPMAPSQPGDPRLSQAQVYRDRAIRSMQEADAMASRIDPKSPNSVLARTQVEARRLQAQRDEQAALVLEGQVHAERYADKAAERQAELERERLKAQHPQSDLPAEADAFRRTVLQNGITSGAALATDGYFSSLKMAVPSTDPQYQTRLQMNQLAASGVALADRIAKRRPLVLGDPTLSEMASVIYGMHPKKPADRAEVVRRIVSNAQMQTGVSPEWSARMAAAMTQLIEQQIATQGR